MITTTDIKKLEKTFTTKKDIKALREEFKKEFVTKKEFSHSIEELIELITSLGSNITSEIRALREEVVSHNDIIEDHERRLDRVEDKVFN